MFLQIRIMVLKLLRISFPISTAPVSYFYGRCSSSTPRCAYRAVDLVIDLHHGVHFTAQILRKSAQLFAFSYALYMERLHFDSHVLTHSFYLRAGPLLWIETPLPQQHRLVKLSSPLV